MGAAASALTAFVVAFVLTAVAATVWHRIRAMQM